MRTQRVPSSWERRIIVALPPSPQETALKPSHHNANLGELPLRSPRAFPIERDYYSVCVDDLPEGYRLGT
ncbi:hypothetical protein BOTBODRAFT_30841 [Botryobasidium botryosum FD-172 SS1]|uniref:Uncharacterized protein n=1 Tax=Botryobasidium botryosum (strain FD-172 SS1) TaxID=930990 RepID=A0A067ML71_BOTB1|nr:hypothetical protein BOTBODRAFT_30841 [Botryobasidium botryosum FD-172 SS1]